MDKEKECIVCGEKVKEEDAIYSNSGFTDDAEEKLKTGEKYGFDEIFNFEDGPYCSIDCMETEEDE